MPEEQFIIGVDIGSNSLKAVLLERLGGKTRCLGMHVVRYPEGEEVTPDHQRAALTEVATLFKGRTNRAALVTGDREFMLKFVEKPAMSRDHLDLVMQNEFRAGLANPEDLDATGFVYAVVGEIKSEMASTLQLLTASFPLAHLRQLADLFKAAGLQMVGVYPFALAARECLLTNHLEEITDQDSPFLVTLLNFGATSNQVSVCDKNVLRLARTFPFAGEELSLTLVKTYTVDGQEVVLDRNMAEAYKATVGILSPDEVAGYGPGALEVQVSELIRRGLDRMTQKIRLSLDYFKGQMKAQVSRAYIFGGGANLRGLLDSLGGLILVNEVKELSAFNQVAYTPEGPVELDPPPEYKSLVALAVGAGLCSFQPEVGALNLATPLQGEAAKQAWTFFEKVVVPIGLLLALILVPALYWWMVYDPIVTQNISLKADHESLTTEFTKVAMFKGEYDKLVKQQQELKIRSIFIKNITQRKLFWSKILFELHTLVPNDVWLSELTSSAFLPDNSAGGPPPRGGDSLLIVGHSKTYAALSAFLKNLESSPSIGQLNWRESKREGLAGEIMFSVTCTITPGARKP